MNREELLTLHDEMCAKGKAIMQRKNHDYAGSKGDLPFANFTRCEAIGICTTEAGILVRMSDKLSRLSTFAETGKLLVQDENVEDTLVDLLNYSILLAGYLRQKQSAPPRVETHSVDISNELEALKAIIFNHSDTRFTGWCKRIDILQKCLVPT